MTYENKMNRVFVLFLIRNECMIFFIKHQKKIVQHLVLKLTLTLKTCLTVTRYFLSKGSLRGPRAASTTAVKTGKR